MARLVLMSVDSEFWGGRNVLVTGHTGFKGGWLSHWLTEMGAMVSGLALDPVTDPSFYEVTGLGSGLAADLRVDIRDLPALRAAVAGIQPEIVFHLAAQPLVRRSYTEPVETFATNVMGCVHLLESLRETASARAIVMVTTDKCYENREWFWPYRETDALGGHDPYSASKAGSEIVTTSYRRSFFNDGAAIASARAGNVIGGGDWSPDRLIPDVLKAMDAGEAVHIRSPRATRPWQHVLEPVAGYLALAQALVGKAAEVAEAWNFGPDENDTKSVGEVMAILATLEPDRLNWQIDDRAQPHEAGLLTLSSAKARALLDWRPRWNVREALRRTLDWHAALRRGDDMARVTSAQIADYGAQV